MTDTTITLTAEELRALSHAIAASMKSGPVRSSIESKIEAAEDAAEPNPCTMIAVGLCMASVCTNLPIDEALAWVNTQHPTGLSGRWELSEDDFSGGETNPCPCNDHPETHKHYLLEC